MQNSDDMEEYFSGRQLYGEHLSEIELNEWLTSEAEGFANLGAKDRGSYNYGYHAINYLHGFRHLKDRRFKHALGFGSAYGHELEPVIDRVEMVTLLDASSSFVVSEIDGRPVRYIKASPRGDIDLPDSSADLVTCFGVLHHIPRVSRSLDEMYRVLEPGGVALIREPVTSMGDWRAPRPGLTKHERGIPKRLLDEMLRERGFQVVAASPCFFPATERLWKPTGRTPWDSKVAVKIDAAISRLFAWNDNYHRQGLWARLAPGCVFWVAKK
jgi:SAM-dependent methyltransferase